MKTLTITKTQVPTDVVLLHKTFIGSCYLVSVVGVAISLIFAVISIVVPTTAVPVKITAVATSNSVTLNWTAPGDDNNIGLADQYDIRYATFPITEENFSSATVVPNPPTPQISGTTETFEVTGLTPDTLYYFALKTADEVPNWSNISNLVSKRTAAIESCVPSWSCADWSVCENSIKTRTCLDLNYCGTEDGKPETQVSCTEIPPPPTCQESWSCTDWADCFRDYQRRVCTDQNQCGTTANKPVEIIECAVGGQEPLAPQEKYLVVSPSLKSGPHIRVYDNNFQLKSQFFAYDLSFRNGVNNAIGDVDGDGLAEIVTGTGAGSAPHVRIFDTAGKIKYQFFAYPSNFRIGVSLTTGDLDGDGRAEIIVAPQARGGPQIRIFKYQSASKSFSVYKQFFVYPTNFRLGLNLTSADLNNDGRAEIIVAPISYGGPHVRVFTLDPVSGNLKLLSQFFAYALNFRGGVNLTTGDVDNDGLKEIITGSGSGGAPHVRIFDIKGKVKYQFFASSTNFRGGIDVTSFDYDLDGADEVLTGTYSAGPPGVIAFQFNPLTKKFTQEKYFLVYSANYREGIRISGY
ncbi:MAG: FG-GAP-like repeat-containing protein [Patescibacteria group bacterium]